MIRKASRLLIILCASSLLLTSCWDYKDINMRSITISIGVDSIDDHIEFSGEIAKIQSSGQKQQEQATATDVYNILSHGKSFEEGRLDFDSMIPFPTFLGATRVVVFGKNFAKMGIEPYLRRIDSLYDYRKTLLPVVSQKRPKELFETKTHKDLSVGFLIEDTLTHLEENGEALYPNVGDLLTDISFGKIGYLIPYIGIENDSIKYVGMAVMKNSKMIDVIKIKNTSGILYILSENPSLIETTPSIKDEKNIFSFRTMVKKRTIKTDYINEKVVIDINLDLNAELRYQYYISKVSDEDIKKYEKIISQKVRSDIASIIQRSQKEMKCDIFKFAKKFRGEHPKIYEKINWEEEFPEAKINVNVKTKIINTTSSDYTVKKKY